MARADAPPDIAALSGRVSKTTVVRLALARGLKQLTKELDTMALKPHVARRIKTANLDLLDLDTFRVRCRSCGAWWSPDILPGGELPKNWWRCPNGCNSHASD